MEFLLEEWVVHKEDEPEKIWLQTKEDVQLWKYRLEDTIESLNSLEEDYNTLKNKYKQGHNISSSGTRQDHRYLQLLLCQGHNKRDLGPTHTLSHFNVHLQNISIDQEQLCRETYTRQIKDRVQNDFQRTDATSKTILSELPTNFDSTIFSENCGSFKQGVQSYLCISASILEWICIFHLWKEDEYFIRYEHFLKCSRFR